MASLEELYVRDCCLSELPPSLGNMRSLELLDASGNAGLRLPATITQLTNLKSLNLNWTCSPDLQVRGN